MEDNIKICTHQSETCIHQGPITDGTVLHCWYYEKCIKEI